MELLLSNLLSPIILAFLLGVFAAFIKSELEFPEPVLRLLSIYLLLSIGIKGGRELSLVTWGEVSSAIGVTMILVLLLPSIAYIVARKVGKFDIHNAGGVAALYGSVSSVTFLASINFAKSMGTPAEGFMPALIALMEWGIIVALFIARWNLSKQEQSGSLSTLFVDTLRSRGIVLLGGGLMIGYLIGDAQYKKIEPFYEDMFQGFLMLFILEMGMTAARQLRGFAKVGWFMLAYSMCVPLINGTIGVLLGSMAGLSLGGMFVLGAVSASASYIDAPAAVRTSLPKANPSIYLTASLGITFPFNLLVGLPLYYELAKFLNQ